MCSKHSIKLDFVQKYIRDHIKEVDIMDHHLDRYYYEVTVTFDQKYWSLNNSLNSIPQIVADILKPIVKSNFYQKFQIAYVVEYHKNGYPHLHAQIINSQQIDPQDQKNIHQRLCRRYGKSQWYQTGQENKIHFNDKFPDGVLWSEYIKKDIELNEANGQRHYFQYSIGF